MNDDLDRHEAAWLRGRLDDELAGLTARPEALQKVLDRGQRTPPRDAARPDRGRGPHRPVPPWLVVAAAVAAVAATLPLVRSAQHPATSSGGVATGTLPSATPTSPSPASVTTSDRPSSSTTQSPYVILPTGTSGASTPRCDGPSLVVSVTGPQGAAGTTFHTLLLTNTGRATCYLKGYPGVAATGGAPTLDARREPGPQAVKVLLQPGQAAHALLAVQDVSTGSAPCPSYTRLLVTAPDSRHTTTIPLQVHPCDGGLRVTTVQPGAGPG